MGVESNNGSQSRKGRVIMSIFLLLFCDFSAKVSKTGLHWVCLRIAVGSILK